MSIYLPGQSHQLLLAITVFYSQRAARRENVSIIKYHTSNPICPPEGKGFHKGSYLDLLISLPIFAIKPQYSPQPLCYLWVFFPHEPNHPKLVHSILSILTYPNDSHYLMQAYLEVLIYASVASML